ncbi:DUF3793 family protein [Clostridium formicaceticum]|uniref:DUF3793 domain-containing protein n=1 Tax=Clostridium formicaceticum TaxID=1497 RepID=A0AAC9WEX6_9CLOT|nr:DUF3793 family protein [Clostridium formicaceticum]AOY75903.1 hypothetical protein BJL90_08355 [Clostridium formicaceticum]ARE86247.1 hypothetical protein CLFO_05690 [Clostridium formicaceticum]
METNKSHCYCLNKTNQDTFMKWIVELLAPVLLGAKPSEIMSFPENDKMGIERREKIKKVFDNSSKVYYREFQTDKGCKKILFYNLEVLDSTLKEFKNIKFLKEQGYPYEYNINTYLDCLIKKMENGVMPHEIGVFLGYPLKDVIGFIGHPSLKLTKVKGWRIYGDPRLSDEKYMKILAAKEKVKRLLEINHPQEIIQSA